MRQICWFAVAILLTSGAGQADQNSTIQLRIAAAQKQLQLHPDSPSALNALGFALIRQARALEDEQVYAKAGEAVDKSLQKQPGNYDGQKLKVAVLLGLNEPGDALKLATELNRKVPDDIAVWALLVDCQVRLGNYDQAEKAAQWVLDLRSASELGFEKAAMLREYFGDTEGALEFLDESIRRTGQNDWDQRSWLLTQKARLLLDGNEPKKAAELLQQAIQLSPESLLAQAELARVRFAEGDTAAAVQLMESRYRQVPSASHLYDYAAMLASAGKTEESATQFHEFEKAAQKEWTEHRASAVDLITYYTDRSPHLEEALRLARAELQKRHDSALLAAYAWALYRSGDASEARAQMGKALEVGIRRVEYFCHAAVIESAAKDQADADKYRDAVRSMGIRSCPGDNPSQQAAEVRP